MTTTRANTDSKALLAELDVLLRLTRTEAQIARIRVGQARRDDIRKELQDNARQAEARAVRIERSIRKLGGAPDVFADAVGRVVALGKVGTEQGQPFSEGLLGDLTLEHQLRDRAVFARVLAEAQDQAGIVTVLRGIEDAHTETIEWIQVRLAEVAQGDEAAMAPTVAQSAVSAVTRFAMLPARSSASLLNKTVNALQRGRNKAEQAVESTVERAEESAKATNEVLSAGRNAALARAEEVAPSKDVRKAAHETRKELGTIDAKDLPVRDYDDLPASAVNDKINAMENPEDVRVVQRYEEAHKARKGVVNAAQKRLSDIAAAAVSV